MTPSDMLSLKPPASLQKPHPVPFLPGISSSPAPNMTLRCEVLAKISEKGKFIEPNHQFSRGQLLVFRFSYIACFIDDAEIRMFCNILEKTFRVSQVATEE